MAREMFGIEPDPAQEKVLEAFPHTRQIAMQACTGAGKTCVLALLGLNFLITRPFPKIGATSISGDNLRANLRPEIARLYEQSPFMRKKFEMIGGNIHAREHPETWRLEFRTWAKDANLDQMGAALKGLHADYVMWLADEVGAYPRALLPSLEAIFSGGPKEAHIVAAGNPVSRMGMLYVCCVTNRRFWMVIEITADPDDPQRTSRVSMEHARQQIDQWGRDNPWVRMNVLGKFPLADVNGLIGEDEALASMKRSYSEFHLGESPKILGVDVAAYGDDQSVICPRWGLQVMNFRKFRQISPTMGAGIVVRQATEWSSDAEMIDDTGGFGASWIDQMINLGRPPIRVPFAGQAHNPARFVNKRAEMAFDAVEWIRRGGALPYDAPLLAALTETTYTFQGDRVLLEPKEMVKKRLNGASPDEFDALICTFAEPVAARRSAGAQRKANRLPEYNPFASIDKEVGR